jgi:hypothetical protein
MTIINIREVGMDIKTKYFVGSVVFFYLFVSACSNLTLDEVSNYDQFKGEYHFSGWRYSDKFFQKENSFEWIYIFNGTNKAEVIFIFEDGKYPFNIEFEINNGKYRERLFFKNSATTEETWDEWFNYNFINNYSILEMEMEQNCYGIYKKL